MVVGPRCPNSIYLDDVLVFGSTFEEHMERVVTVLSWFEVKARQMSPVANECEFPGPYHFLRRGAPKSRKLG